MTSLQRTDDLFTEWLREKNANWHLREENDRFLELVRALVGHSENPAEIGWLLDSLIQDNDRLTAELARKESLIGVLQATVLDLQHAVVGTVTRRKERIQ